MQLLAKVPNNEIDLIVSHDLLSCYHFATPLGSTHKNRTVSHCVRNRSDAPVCSQLVQ